MLTQERLKELLNYDPLTGIFSWRVNPTSTTKMGDIAGSHNGRGYIQIRIAGKRYAAHRLAWLYVYGRNPVHQIDHINRISSDNRVANLREATASENLQNTKLSSRNKSGVKGVYWNSRDENWGARIWRGCFIHLGYHASFFDAVCARKAAEIQYHPYRAA